MSLLFAALTIQMVALTFLVLPLPLKIRRPLLNVYIRISESREFKTVYYITNILVLLLFIDSFQKVIKLKTDDGELKSTYNLNNDRIVKVFYNQRNLYISGIIVFFSIAIPTVFQIIRRLVKYQELKLENKKAEDPILLKKKIEALTKDLEAFKKQKAGLEKQFQELTFKEKSTGNKKTD
jgi:phosphatidylglycerophosphate synthase